MTKREISSISVISSAVCNLNCSFCYLHKNSSYQIFNDLVRKAWNDGSYITNLVKTLDAINADFEKVEIIQLWGGETFLTIEDMIPNISSFYNYFQNINQWQFSTNWTVDINKVFEFIKEIDNCASIPTEVKIQVSIDGPPGPISESGHNGGWEVYRKNFKDFLFLVNNYKFKNINILFNVNSVVGKDVFFEELNTKDKLRDYFTYMNEFFSWVKELCISRSVDIGSIFIYPGLALPYNECVEDGEEYARICRIWESLRVREFPEVPMNFLFSEGTGEVAGEKPICSSNNECGELKCALTINYDGSICECNGSYIDAFEPYQEELKKENNLNEFYATKIRSAVSYNPAKLSEEEKAKKDWYIYNGYKNNSLTYLHLMFATCKELAMSGQIPRIYLEDDELLLNHLIANSFITSCTKENAYNTRIPYMTNPETFRRYFNGVIQDSYELVKLSKKNELKEIIDYKIKEGDNNDE